MKIPVGYTIVTDSILSFIVYCIAQYAIRSTPFYYEIAGIAVKKLL